ncbi:hypothetical protein LTR66_001040 [Elasticomyces elasticus]|nr:hypothetical protein LTR66_001040 [Elasticomyces elasticus]
MTEACDTSALEHLRRTIRTCPVVDNHAHNLLRPTQLKTYPFLSITSEAHGGALEDHTTALSHLRAARQLSELYGCDEDVSWDALLVKRQEMLEKDPEGLIRTCLEGTHTLLLDDGIDDGTTVHPYQWHDRFTTGSTRRIVRIETVARDIMKRLHDPDQPWEAIEDRAVVGFKSVICYRTGLDVKPQSDDELQSAVLADL